MAETDEVKRAAAARDFALGLRHPSIWRGFGAGWRGYVAEFDGVTCYVQARVDAGDSHTAPAIDEWVIYAGGVDITNLIADGSHVWNAFEADVLNAYELEATA